MSGTWRGAAAGWGVAVGGVADLPLTEVAVHPSGRQILSTFRREAMVGPLTVGVSATFSSSASLQLYEFTFRRHDLSLTIDVRGTSDESIEIGATMDPDEASSGELVFDISPSAAMCANSVKEESSYRGLSHDEEVEVEVPSDVNAEVWASTAEGVMISVRNIQTSATEARINATEVQMEELRAIMTAMTA